MATAGGIVLQAGEPPAPAPAAVAGPRSLSGELEEIARELPRSPVGKVLKRALRDEHRAGQERLV